MIWLISFVFSSGMSVFFDTVLNFLDLYCWYVSLGYHIVTFVVLYIFLDYIWDD